MSEKSSTLLYVATCSLVAYNAGTVLGLYQLKFAAQKGGSLCADSHGTELHVRRVQLRAPHCSNLQPCVSISAKHIGLLPIGLVAMEHVMQGEGEPLSQQISLYSTCKGGSAWQCRLSPQLPAQSVLG